MMKAPILSAVMAAMLAGVAQAQTVAPPSTAKPVAPNTAAGCAPTALPPSGQGAPSARQADTTGQAVPLSDKLAQSDGVLCPPAGVDPEIRAPTPDVGRTPVIPPPGSPGGDPTVRPK